LIHVLLWIVMVKVGDNHQVLLEAVDVAAVAWRRGNLWRIEKRKRHVCSWRAGLFVLAGHTTVKAAWGIRHSAHALI
jgi:hypothetical protein